MTQLTEVYVTLMDINMLYKQMVIKVRSTIGGANRIPLAVPVPPALSYASAVLLVVTTNDKNVLACVCVTAMIGRKN